MGLIEKLREIRAKLKWLDPFTYVDLFIVDRVKKQNKTIQNIVFLACMLFVSAMFYLFANGKAIPLTFFVLLAVGLTGIIYFYFKEEAVEWGIYLASAFFFALVIFGGAGILLGTGSPMMIVVSGSMEPIMYRGDILFLQGTTPEELLGKEVTLDLHTLENMAVSDFAELIYAEGSAYKIRAISFFDGQELELDKSGDIIVYFSNWRNEPIVHRVVAKLNAGDGTYLVTKGDSVNNPTIDQDCGKVVNGIPEKRGCISLYPINADSIQGKSVFIVPFIGYAKLLVFDAIPTLIFGCKNPAGCPFP